MKLRKKILLAIGILILVPAVIYISITPSNDRDWSVDQAVLAKAEITGNMATIRNIRNFSYASTDSYTPGYYDKTFDIAALKKVWFIVEPFSGNKGAAHTFVSFEFEGDQFLAISVEIRKEKGESFSAVKGILKRYELMYVAGDERDLIKLRSNYRKDLVYVYPTRTTKENSQKLFVEMLERMNKLAEQPEFYNTLTNTCTTNIVRHINNISPKRIPNRSEIIFPAESDRLAYELGLIDTELPFEEARKTFLINDRAERYADSPDFSRRIRSIEEN